MNELYHHGILGQKWGVRRYQNEDGTLTTAGKTRYNKSSSMSDEEIKDAVKKMNLQRSYDNLVKEQNKNSTLNRTKKVIDTSSNFVNQAKNLNDKFIKEQQVNETLDLSSMTDKELRDKINRKNLERQYNDLFTNKTESISKGQQYVSNVLEIGGSILTIGSSALGIALAIKDLRN